MILSIDTFSDTLGIAVIKDHRVLIKETIGKTKPFSELIITRLDKLFKDFQLNKEDIVALVVNKGPGSLTSLRVGITVVKTIAYSLKKPVYSYSSLDVMAYKYRCFNGKIISAINAGKGEIFLREYLSNNFEVKPVSDIKLEKQSVLENKKDGMLVVKNINISGKNVFHILEDLSVEGAFYSLKNHTEEDIFKLEPLYIRGL